MLPPCRQAEPFTQHHPVQNDRHGFSTITANSMTPNYYFKLYQLTEEEIEELLPTTESNYTEDVVAAYARRWIEEFRLEFPSATQCRAIVFREMVESGRESGGPERLVIPWAHMLTDQVAERVEAFDRGIWKN
jgi:hypothetical protein